MLSGPSPFDGFFADTQPASASEEWTVSQLSTALKRTLETHYGAVRVKGELSGVKLHSSGHLYFALKDADALIDGICWRGTVSRLNIRPAEGMEVVATGKITTYAGRSKYQIIVEDMQQAGVGALLQKLEELKRRLHLEGLFDLDRKKPLPVFPRGIGVITSPTGAVIRDILHRLEDRFPCPVYIWPVAVQGVGSAEQIAVAIEKFNSFVVSGQLPLVDVLIVARGGGSLEDLWSFNDEKVVRATANSSLPLISAVGHETDTTLIDYAASRRAPTPTAAAEIATPVRADLIAILGEITYRLTNSFDRLVNLYTTRLEGLVRGLPDLESVVGEKAQRLDDLSSRLQNGFQQWCEGSLHKVLVLGARLQSPMHLIELTESKFKVLAERMPFSMERYLKEQEKAVGTQAQLLQSYSYHHTLERGFAMVRDAQGQPVSRAKQLQPEASISLQFYDETVKATVT